MVPTTNAMGGTAVARGATDHAHGKFGRVIGVFPAQEVVVVRLGSTDAGGDWQGWMQGVAARVSRGAR